MPDAPRPTAHHAKPHAFEIKGANLPLVALLLKTTDMAVLASEWQQQYGDSPDFFDDEPLVIDLKPLATTEMADQVPDFSALSLFLRRQRTWPVAVKGGTPAQMAAALASGLVAAPEAVLQRAHEPSAGATGDKEAKARPPAPSSPTGQVADSGTPGESASTESTTAVNPDAAAAVDEVTALPPAAQAPSALPALVVDKPLRSGQQVYARGRDLVVMAMVNPGAEVIADGHIHVYAPLRGKAIAGARGNGDARIFALSLEAELISIAGIYRTSDVPLPEAVRGKPAMVSLQPTPEGDKLVVSAIHH